MVCWLSKTIHTQSFEINCLCLCLPGTRDPPLTTSSQALEWMGKELRAAALLAPEVVSEGSTAGS